MDLSPRNLRGLCTFLPLLLLQGCATVVVPPQVRPNAVTVFLLDHGHHSSLVLPTASDRIVRYAYGDWAYYAKADTGLYRGTAALLWPTQGALGRRELPGPPTAAAVRREVRVPIVRLYALKVRRSKAERLRRHLDGIFRANIKSVLYNPLYDLYFVHDPQPYDVAHDSNREVAHWLIRLGCRIRGGPALLSNWKVERPAAASHSGRPLPTP
ncbi:MAG: hypothetical protein P8180_07385 [Gammaproteobacteria bacterium]|jgi:hypothetical protein